MTSERVLLAEAAITWAATEEFSREAGEKLIDAAIEVISAWYEVRRLRIVRSPTPRMTEAILKLEDLVGRP